MPARCLPYLAYIAYDPTTYRQFGIFVLVVIATYVIIPRRLGKLMVADSQKPTRGSGRTFTRMRSISDRHSEPHRKRAITGRIREGLILTIKTTPIVGDPAAHLDAAHAAQASRRRPLRLRQLQMGHDEAKFRANCAPSSGRAIRALPPTRYRRACVAKSAEVTRANSICTIRLIQCTSNRSKDAATGALATGY
jgi:hypothetical protein